VIATTQANNATTQANAAAASAASAAAIVNISSVTTFTNPLAQAVSVQMTASASVGGIQQLDNDNLDMGTNDFTLEFDELLPTTRPAAAIVLDRKHDGTNGYILSVLTTGIVRLQINGFTYDSTVALASATNVNPKLQVPVIRETATVAGSVTFYSNGVILGVAVAITAHGDLTTELVTNGTFDTDITGWTKNELGDGVADFFNNSLRIATNSTGVNTYVYQSVTTVVGATYKAVTNYNVTTGPADITLRIFATVDNGTVLGTVGPNAVTSTGTLEVFFVATSAVSVVRLQVRANFDVVEFDNVSIKRVATVNNASARIVNGTTTTRTAGSLQAARLFNRALTSAEVLDLSINGPALADRGASQALVTVSNFAAGVDGYVAVSNVALAGNIDGIGGVDDTLRVTVSATGTNRRFQKTSGDIQNIRSGERWDVSFDVYFAVGNVTTRSVHLTRTAGNLFASGALLVTTLAEQGTWFNVQLKGLLATADTTTGLFFEIAGGGLGINATSGDIVYFKNIQWKKLGLTSELLASNAQSNTGQIFDTSGNKNHALLPASGATVVGRPVSQTREVRWTNTWAGTNELQYIGGVNQAILPANAYIESIVGTVSGATPHDIIIGDGSDTDRYVTITTGLAAGTTTFTLASRTTDGTNLKLTADPDTDCTMSIAWVIKYTTLES
jgi:hypothetical protein